MEQNLSGDYFLHFFFFSSFFFYVCVFILNIMLNLKERFDGSEGWILPSVADGEIVTSSLCWPVSGRGGRRLSSSLPVQVFCVLGQWHSPWAGMLGSQSSGWSW